MPDLKVKLDILNTAAFGDMVYLLKIVYDRADDKTRQIIEEKLIEFENEHGMILLARTE